MEISEHNRVKTIELIKSLESLSKESRNSFLNALNSKTANAEQLFDNLLVVNAMLDVIYDIGLSDERTEEWVDQLVDTKNKIEDKL